MKHLLLALALVSVAPRVQDDAVRKLVDQLGAEEYETREKATEELVRLGEKAIPHLKEALKSPDAEVRSRAEGALKRIRRVSYRGETLLAGRTGARMERVTQAGGNEKTEEAVAAALGWLARHQSDDGSWKTQGHVEKCAKDGKCPGRDTAPEDYDGGVTGLALLSFLGTGYSHLSREKIVDLFAGDIVRKALQWMMSHQDPEGCIGSRNAQKYMYSHAIASLAFSEAYGLSRSNFLKDQAQKAVDFTLAAQNPGKAWRYSTKCGDNDTSVTFWAALSLVAARDAGLRVTDRAFEGMGAWLDEVTDDSYFRTGYTHKGTGKVFVPGLNEEFDHHESLTAIGVFLRLVTRRTTPDSVVARSGTDLLLRDPPLWEKNRTDFYYWHTASLALFQQDGPEGPRWRAWNEKVKEALVPHQNGPDKGCRAGSWDPVGRWCGEGGRVSSTALAALTLQTYYRYGLGK